MKSLSNIGFWRSFTGSGRSAGGSATLSIPLFVEGIHRSLLASMSTEVASYERK